MVNRLICSTSSSSGAGVVSGASQPAVARFHQPHRLICNWKPDSLNRPGRLNQPGDILFLYVAQEDQGDMKVFRRYAASRINR